MCDKSRTPLGLRGEFARAHQGLGGVPKYRAQPLGVDIVLGLPDDLQRCIPSNSETITALALARLTLRTVVHQHDQTRPASTARIDHFINS